MRWLFLVLLISFAGCQNVRAPWGPQAPVRVDDPILSMYEQRRLGRDRLPLPDDTRTAGPDGVAALPGGSFGNGR
ncbi:MAG: hypothetical protein L0Y72_06935 [Gemmataceae bacterium]|nr:hypothetical protein [Gemmataceae bacterium]MCI0738760.1 hypothetical protein [Gemmataceae bacterium]